MRMNMAQRIVLSISLGMTLIVIGLAFRAWVWESSPADGWFNYAPNNGVIFTSDDPGKGSIIGQAAVWIALVVVWAVLTLLLVRRRPDDRTSLRRIGR